MAGLHVSGLYTVLHLFRFRTQRQSAVFYCVPTGTTGSKTRRRNLTALSCALDRLEVVRCRRKQLPIYNLAVYESELVEQDGDSRWRKSPLVSGRSLSPEYSLALTQLSRACGGGPVQTELRTSPRGRWGGQPGLRKGGASDGRLLPRLGLVRRCHGVDLPQDRLHGLLRRQVGWDSHGE